MPKPAAAALSSPRRRRWKIADARETLNALAASGLSLVEFARREGIQRERLRRWKHRLAREARPARRAAAAPASALIEIRPRRSESIEIVLASGVTLRVAETVDPAALARLVAALERGY